MIVLTSDIKAKPGRRDELAKAAAVCVEKTRSEAGCIRYELLLSSENENNAMFYEEWESEEHLKAHLASEHVAQFRAAIKDLTEGKNKLTIYESVRKQDM